MISPTPTSYTPAPSTSPWSTLAPTDAGFSPARLQDAIDFAVANESPWPRSLYYPDGAYVGNVEWNETGPWSEIVGPVAARGGPAGLVLKGGRIVAEWGDTDRTDMTFSIAKSYLSVLAGVALGDGLIRDLDEPVAKSVAGPVFAGAHNAEITWRHLLQQSSEWQGEIFGKSDQVDHNRQIGPGADNSRKGQRRELNRPGSFYEYNDVRVNVLGYALLQLFRRPLPEVLRERIMDPIGASQDWRWEGYETSFVEIDGQRIQSVPGGGHWGGGLVIGARDHARFGLLMARRGIWEGKQLLPPAYVEMALTPSPTLANYGLLWWLNRGPEANPKLPSSAFSALGAGSNVIWIDPEHDLVAVLRWIDGKAAQGFCERLVAALD
ncbi:serine hydrolase domain-containing protein [Bosea caraganae]|uniref:serine hydrolase domain-containing protein n=1 Tax=Bosea caraganae TaxID=2763117 RepID=UPI001FE82B75|nr:serine hydrolase [Bosea caraganae]